MSKFSLEEARLSYGVLQKNPEDLPRNSRWNYFLPDEPTPGGDLILPPFDATRSEDRRVGQGGVVYHQRLLDGAWTLLGTRSMSDREAAEERS